MKEKKNRILLVEDEQNLATSLRFNLEAEGWTVLHAENGNEAVSCFSAQKFDLVLLDIMLPGMNGFEVLRNIRITNPRIPVLILTARAASADRVLGLTLGADDYLTKPFHLTELILRVRGMLKRKRWYIQDDTDDSDFSFGKNTVYFDRLTACSGKKEFPLTPLEASLLGYFIKKKNMLVTKKELIENVWNLDPGTETRTPDNFIVRLRKYFEPDPARPVFFRTVRCRGYMFTPDGSGR